MLTHLFARSSFNSWLKNFGLIALFFYMLSPAQAMTGPLFQISQSGAPGEISLSLCLNVHGRKPLSCQNLNVQSSNLIITPTVPNRTYPYAGVRVNTPEFTLENLGLPFSGKENGYGVFQFSDSAPLTTAIPNQLAFLAQTNPVVATLIAPTNIVFPVPTVSDPTPTIIISVADLQAMFNSQFCQLNTQHNVTLLSPQCQTLIDYISQQDGTDHFNLNSQPILNNSLNIEDVEFRQILYTTTVTLPDGPRTFNVSGGLVMPNQIDKAQLKGVIIYFHGTQTSKADVGSNINYAGTQVVAALFASQGYIVVIPDYVGMGVDWEHVHPYVIYPIPNVQAGLDMLTAVKTAIQDKYSFINPEVIKLHSLGFSEGGAYSLWFNTYVHDNPSTLDNFYLLTHSIGLEGAYSAQVTSAYLFDNVIKAGANFYHIQSQSLVNLSKPLLASFVFLSYATYSLQSNYGAVFNMDFFNMNCESSMAQSNCNTNGQHVNQQVAIAQESASPATSILNSALGKRTGSSAYPKNLATLAISLFNKGIPFTNSESFPTSPGWLQAQNAASVNLSNLPANAVSIITLSNDSIVTPNNFDAMVQLYPAQLKNAIKLDENNLQVVSPFSYTRAACLINPSCPATYSPVDHTQAQPYEYLYALKIFNGF